MNIYEIKHEGGIETKDGFICETCYKKFRTDYELEAHQGNPVIYSQKDMDMARQDERARFIALLESPELLEKLAAQEHDRWSRWEICREKVIQGIPDIQRLMMNIPDAERKEIVAKLEEKEAKLQGWHRKRETPYAKLTNKEQERARKEARRTQQAMKEFVEGKVEK